MDRREFLRASSIGLAALALTRRWARAAETTAPAAAPGTAPHAGAAKPNIIFILGDDVGLPDIGCCGSDHFQTPHIDALARVGTRFEYSYAAPLCGPSRCEILTGRYPFRTGLISNDSANAVQPGREIMIPTIMKAAGYATALVGKWGQICLGPGEWGFDEYLSFKGSGRYWASQKPEYVVNGRHRQLGEHEYLPDTMHDFLADYITRHQDRPFYVHYAMSHIHGPILATPDSKPGATAAQLYADNIACMDKLVGRITDTLEKLNLREKTLLLFTGDNGTAHGGATTSTLGGRRISGMKGRLTEGGSRVPLIAAWPGVVPSGRVNHDLTDFSDFLPTFAELGGARLPENVILDGRSFAPQLKGLKGQPRDWVYVELNGHAYAREARYKLTNEGNLFDLRDAPFTETPVAEAGMDAAAADARRRLQTVLDQHPAAAGLAAAGRKPKRRRVP